MNNYLEIRAWRYAFFHLLEIEQPTEVPCQGRENLNGWIYRAPRPTDQYSAFRKSKNHKYKLANFI